MSSSNETNPTAPSHPLATRKTMRNEINRILSQTVLPPPIDRNSHRMARRIAARKALSFRIEKSLYRRAPSMKWYNDRSALTQRVIKIAKEMLRATIRRDEERSRRTGSVSIRQLIEERAERRRVQANR
eukprot:scaffold334474_cov86-Cyclotella_meneghiniana.AAC.1